MSSNYPNMSYCMMNNTHLGLEQVVEAMQDAQAAGRAGTFVDSLSKEEARSYQRLVDLANSFMNMAEEFEQAKIDANSSDSPEEWEDEEANGLQQDN